MCYTRMCILFLLLYKTPGKPHLFLAVGVYGHYIWTPAIGFITFQHVLSSLSVAVCRGLQCYECRGISHMDENGCVDPESGKTTQQECRKGYMCEVSVWSGCRTIQATTDIKKDKYCVEWWTFSWSSLSASVSVLILLITSCIPSCVSEKNQANRQASWCHWAWLQCKLWWTWLHLEYGLSCPLLWYEPV